MAARRHRYDSSDSSEEDIAAQRVFVRKAKKAGLRKLIVDTSYKVAKLQAADPEYRPKRKEKAAYTAIRSMNSVIAKYSEKQWKSDWVAINVNLEDDDRVHELMSVCDAFVHRNWISYYAYVLEQRSDCWDEPHGFHVHMMINYRSEVYGRQKKSRITEQINNVFLKFVGGRTERTLLVKPCSLGREIGMYHYITGDKLDGRKRLKVETDVKVRERLGYKDIYTNIKERELDYVFPTEEREIEEEREEDLPERDVYRDVRVEEACGEETDVRQSVSEGSDSS